MSDFKNNLELSDKISAEAKEDIIELNTKIKAFRNLQMDEEKFRSFRLTRGVYGQRQEGVQMIRIKLPFGKITPEQLVRVAEVSDEFAAHNLHLTTRQDIQIHYVQLENAPKVWAKLEEVNVTTREACGNAVRNITASATAGIDPKEPFDVTPYAYEHFRFFLRNPVCQEMGRKFKISFSSSDDDSAYGFMHDLGFIPKVKTENGKEVRGFKVFIAGGLGAQAFMAFTAYEFLAEDQIIPFTEAVIRVFDRYGERTKRNKARLKYLVNGIGFEKFMELVEGERKALKVKSYTTNRNILPESKPSANTNIKVEEPANKKKFDTWVKTNVFEQKQQGYYAVNIRVFLGDMPTDQARLFAAIVTKYASEDIRITVNQGYMLSFVKKEFLAALHNELDKIGLGEAGFDSLLDITACPGTDTCNLGISSSTGISAALEKMLEEEFPDMAFEKNIKIKVSGCMNACAQHTVANIGFHGSSIKNGVNVLPAMQLMLGGGIEPDGSGSLADKVVKLPSKKCPEAVRRLLNDYEEKALEGEYFNNYFRRMVAIDKIYFYKMLKPLADLNNVVADDYIDYGHTDKYETLVGVGECAGAMLDLVTTLISETEDKAKWAQRAFDKGAYADSIYSSYTTFISGAKALLISETIQCNTQIGILNDFDEHFVKKGLLTFAEGNFHDHVMKMNDHEPSKEFAALYLSEAKEFFNKLIEIRTRQLAEVKK